MTYRYVIADLESAAAPIAMQLSRGRWALFHGPYPGMRWTRFPTGPQESPAFKLI